MLSSVVQCVEFSATVVQLHTWKADQIWSACPVLVEGVKKLILDLSVWRWSHH